MQERRRLLLAVISAGLVCAAMTWIVHRSLDSVARSTPSAHAEPLLPVASRLSPVIVPFDVDNSSQIEAGQRASSAQLRRRREERLDNRTHAEWAPVHPSGGPEVGDRAGRAESSDLHGDRR